MVLSRPFDTMKTQMLVNRAQLNSEKRKETMISLVHSNKVLVILKCVTLFSKCQDIEFALHSHSVEPP